MQPPDDDAFASFMYAASPRLYRVAYLLAGDAAQAEELTQQTLVRTYTAWARIDAGDAYGYARRILVNLHNDWWRRRFLRERPVAAVPEPRRAERDPADAVVARQSVAQALQGLTRRERAAVVCRFYLDLTEQQTADELGVAIGTVKSTTARALRKLRIDPALHAVTAVDTDTKGRRDAQHRGAPPGDAGRDPRPRPRVTFAQVRQRARRRRFTLLATFLAAVLVPVGATVTALAGSPAGPGPLPPPARSGAAPVPSDFATGTEFPGAGEIVRTGIAYGADEEFVLRYSGDGMNGVWSGLYNPKTSQYRRFEGGLTPAPGQFSTILEIEDRRGGIVDYGVVGAAGVRVEVTSDGRQATASTAEVPGMPGTTLFWVRRTGTAVQPTGAPAGGPTPTSCSPPATPTVP
ncbi:SigE family RNA polymerase sigma factor [Dactylosporangium cerinum]